jgi:tetratricopeptide (TPR) repeat protein
MGGHSWMTGQNEAAVEYFERAQGLAERLELTALGIKTHRGRGMARCYLGRYDDAARDFVSALELARASGDQLSETAEEGALGFVSWFTGRYADRKRFHEASLATAVAVRARPRESIAEHNVANVYSDLGSMDAGGPHHERTIEIARQIGDRRGEGLGAFGLAECAERSGDLVKANTRYQTALGIFREIAHTPMVVDALVGLGRVQAGQQQMSTALESLESAFELSRQSALHGKEMLSSAWQSLLRQESAEEAEGLLAEHGSSMPFHDRIEGNFILWKATGNKNHLAEAHRLLLELREHAPEEYRESMIENVQLNREIMEAWEA